ncbi:hypothetical protein [Rubrivivax gelatinosus]|uniref:Uncharacterized protein n=1 Tax=Rubrivivax gelatinosus (strain NBRC 100245 / IL144) TaxID=983917 RepID=I0HNA8_RUBGI|nr:hypothetical protein [Rubrivivax gelatinosus]BAL94495.1 hypothetical protein RGE_11540 [Rubrivivax gelatinosus IL144]
MKTLLALMLGALAANHFYKSRQRRRTGRRHEPVDVDGHRRA